MNRLNQFTCSRCGSHDLSLEKWISCEEPLVFHDNGVIEYEAYQVDETEELAGLGGFMCRSCKTPLTYRGCRIETEEDLIAYLALSPEERQEQEELYQACLEQEAQENEAKQKEIIESYALAEENSSANEGNCQAD